MTYLRALVLLVISMVVVVAVPAVTSATTPDPTEADAAVAEATEATPSATTPAPTTPAPSATTPAPSTSAPTPARLSVESGRSVTHYRERAVTVSASGLDVEDSDEPSAVLRLDGEALQELYVAGGAFEVWTTLPVTTDGEHLVTVTDDERVLASTTIDVGPDLFTVTAKPSWITAEKLATDGVTLSAREVPPNGLVTASFGDNPPVTKRAIDDGTISITLRNTDDSSLERPGVNWGVLETEDGELSSVPVRTTVLDVAVRGTSGDLHATGFEPGTDVTLTSSRGTVTTTTDAQGVATFSLPGFVGEVTASGTAGSVVTLVDTRVDEPPTEGLTDAEVVRLEKQAAAVDELRTAQRDLARIITAQGGEPGPLPPGAQQAVVDQVLAYKTLLGAMPQQPPIRTKAPGKDSIDTQKKLDESLKKQTDVAFDKKASEKELLGDAADAATQVEDAYSRAVEEQQKAIDEMVTKIIQFLREMQEAQADQMRAIVRASTLELVSVGPAGDVVRVPVPVGFTGRHHVGSIEPTSGILLAWQPFDVSATGAGSGATGSALPGAGAPVPPALVALGAGLLLGGASVLALARRRRTL